MEGECPASSLPTPRHSCLGAEPPHFPTPYREDAGAGLFLPCRHFSGELKSFYSGKRLSKTLTARMLRGSLVRQDLGTGGRCTRVAERGQGGKRGRSRGSAPGKRGSAGWKESVGAGGVIQAVLRPRAPTWLQQAAESIAPSRGGSSTSRAWRSHQCCRILLTSFKRHTGSALLCGAWCFCTAIPAALEILGLQQNGSLPCIRAAFSCANVK